MSKYIIVVTTLAFSLVNMLALSLVNILWQRNDSDGTYIISEMSSDVYNTLKLMIHQKSHLN